MHRATCSCHSHSGFLTALGRRAVAQRSCEALGLDATATERYLDKVGSVSAFGPGPGPLWPTDSELLEQGERFLNGSS